MTRLPVFMDSTLSARFLPFTASLLYHPLLPWQSHVVPSNEQEPGLDIGELGKIAVQNDDATAATGLGTTGRPFRKTWTVKYTLRSDFDSVGALCFHPIEPVVITGNCAYCFRCPVFIQGPFLPLRWSCCCPLGVVLATLFLIIWRCDNLSVVVFALLSSRCCNCWDLGVVFVVIRRCCCCCYLGVVVVVIVVVSALWLLFSQYYKHWHFIRPFLSTSQRAKITR